jgi:EAL domain-containing protein (putative c-di-GMP-specific phosphodiesterase class I)
MERRLSIDHLWSHKNSYRTPYKWPSWAALATVPLSLTLLIVLTVGYRHISHQNESSKATIAHPIHDSVNPIVTMANIDDANFLTTELFFLVFFLLCFFLILGVYKIAFTPHQRVRRQVRAALIRKEFFLEYQPIVELTSGRWIGAEVLLRWNHPRHGILMPTKFICEIEQTPTIAPLTEFVLSTALDELESLDLPTGFRVSVNLAPHHILHSSFPEDIISTLRGKASRFQVVFEVTERGLLDGPTATLNETLLTLKTMGVQFAVDDFGTGQSNLALLQRFKFDYIKIDRQFISHVQGSDRPLIEGVALLASRLGASIVAEGVEESEQLKALSEIGIPFAQGYWFQRPTSINNFARVYLESGYGAGLPKVRNEVS